MSARFLCMLLAFIGAVLCMKIEKRVRGGLLKETDPAIICWPYSINSTNCKAHAPCEWCAPTDHGEGACYNPSINKCCPAPGVGEVCDGTDECCPSLNGNYVECCDKGDQCCGSERFAQCCRNSDVCCVSEDKSRASCCGEGGSCCSVGSQVACCNQNYVCNTTSGSPQCNPK
eukprot:NODE_6330_length_644_cov_31.841393_g6307_i0.p1 GENE.NODE_6330_length_644_cov_31.841393_g6307_i0~~NODE_6330_length_644_cov_31.841393_g6307_i0.p1  ORF type:complete len:173 (-),score=21.28 NODE_6330_length_644_cov_31.841393_g6307_i0:52-570(-)